jgi:hypothetical protein
MDDFLVKKESLIHGKGIYTTKDIKVGDIFYVIPVETIANEPRPSWAYLGENTWVSDEVVLNYINHHCEPNAILDVSREPKLIAIKNINVEDEITVDYSQTELNGVKVLCGCGSKNCKKYFLRLE